MAVNDLGAYVVIVSLERNGQLILFHAESRELILLTDTRKELALVTILYLVLTILKDGRDGHKKQYSALAALKLPVPFCLDLFIATGVALVIVAVLSYR